MNLSARYFFCRLVVAIRIKPFYSCKMDCMLSNGTRLNIDCIFGTEMYIQRSSDDDDDDDERNNLDLYCSSYTIRAIDESHTTAK